jgi:hypothetical protein
VTAGQPATVKTTAHVKTTLTVILLGSIRRRSEGWPRPAVLTIGELSNRCVCPSQAVALRDAGMTLGPDRLSGMARWDFATWIVTSPRLSAVQVRLPGRSARGLRPGETIYRGLYGCIV